MSIRESLIRIVAPANKRAVLANQILFKKLTIQEERIFDIAAGEGFQTEYLASRGAEEVVALEPYLKGSGAVEQDNLAAIAEQLDPVAVGRTRSQDYDREDEAFDFVVLRNSVNNLEEDAATVFLKSAQAQPTYSNIL